LVIEGIAPGGQAGTSSKIENYLGFPPASPALSWPIAPRCRRRTIPIFCLRSLVIYDWASSRIGSRAATAAPICCSENVDFQHAFVGGDAGRRVSVGLA
jgi:hypothetical protein